MRVAAAFALILAGTPSLATLDNPVTKLAQVQDQGQGQACSANLLAQCSNCNQNEPTPIHEYDCTLPGLEELTPGMYEGVTANYLSFMTDRSTPHFPVRAKEFQRCTGGQIFFSDATVRWEDVQEDLGTRTSRGSEVYDAYFLRYALYPELSELDLLEHLNDRISQSNSRLEWEGITSKVRRKGEYRKNGVTNIDFLPFDAEFLLPYVRIDLLEKYDLPLPNTWDEVLEYARFFNGTDLNGDGRVDDDFGFCHYPVRNADLFAELVYSTWATMDQTLGVQQGFFFDEDTFEPRLTEGFRYAVEYWKELFKVSTDSPAFQHGNCAIGFGPAGEWKQIILNPNGVSRQDMNGNIIWRPTMKSGDYAEPYRLRPFGTTKVLDRSTGQITECTPELCPQAEKATAGGHHGENDRANSILSKSPIEGMLINRSPFFWSGMGVIIRNSSPPAKKDLMWDFLVYVNGPKTSVNDVATYASWLDAWRFSQLLPGNNYRKAGWSEASYSEHASTMLWALSNDSNGSFNIRLPGLVQYTHDVFGKQLTRFTEDEISIDEVIENVQEGWEEVTRRYGKLNQLKIYRASLGLDTHSEFELCSLHRKLMDKEDPSICKKYDPKGNANLLMATVIPSSLFLVVLLFIFRFGKKSDESIFIPDHHLNFEISSLDNSAGIHGVEYADYFGSRVRTIVSVQARRLRKERSRIAMESAPEEAVDVEQQDDSASMTTSFSASMSSINMKKGPFCCGGSELQLSSAFSAEVKQLSKLRHTSIATVLGATIRNGDQLLITEYTDRGTLYDLLHNETLILEGEILLPILRDVVHGMRYLHSAPIVHGHLCSANCIIDSRFRAKITNFDRYSSREKSLYVESSFWTAPEVLRGDSEPTTEADVYSFGILLSEVYSRCDPYEGEDADEVLRMVVDPKANKRPLIPSSCPSKIQQLMLECLDDVASRRPMFEELDLQLKRLDAEVIGPTQLNRQSRTDSLLFDVFPRHVAEALRDGRAVEPESRDLVTICFSDIIGFTKIASTLSAEKVSDMLGRLYTTFDELSLAADVFKMETIGDAYMSVTNLAKNQSDHAKRIADFAFAAIQAANDTLIDVDDPERGCLEIRVGLHSGPVVATVVGSRNPRYCLFGDSVNTAARIESSSKRNVVHCSEITAMLLKEQSKCVKIVPRGLVELKGKGKIHTYWVQADD